MPRVRACLVQAAIGSQSEAMKRNITLYSIRADHGLQYDMSRMSSTSYNHVLGKSSALFQEKGANAQDFIVANTVDVKDINQVLTDNEIGSFTKEHGGPLETFRLLTVDTEEHDAKVRRPLERARLLAPWPRRRLPQSDPPSRPRPDRC